MAEEAATWDWSYNGMKNAAYNALPEAPDLASTAQTLKDMFK
jgi:hypothetical protein